MKRILRGSYVPIACYGYGKSLLDFTDATRSTVQYCWSRVLPRTVTRAALFLTDRCDLGGITELSSHPLRILTVTGFGSPYGLTHNMPYQTGLHEGGTSPFLTIWSRTAHINVDKGDIGLF